jgi:hypothetical protein
MGYSLTQMTDIILAHLTVAVGDDAVCSIGKQPGDSVALDYADCGAMAWVRHVDSVPSINGYSNDITPDSCEWGLAHTMELGIMRPAITPTETLGHLELPSEEDLTAAADAAMDDMALMHRVLLASRAEMELVPGSYTPVGPLGGTVGGTWSFILAEE